MAIAFLANEPLSLHAQRSITLDWDPSPNVTNYVVYFRTNTSPRAVAVRTDGTTQATVPGLREGLSYFFAVTAVNRFGQESDPTPELPYVVPVTVPTNGPLVVTTRGNGSVTPNLTGQTLIVGQTYTLTGIPGTNYVFDRWNGGVTSSSPALTFVMQPGLSLEAVFVTNNVVSPTNTIAPLEVAIRGNGSVTPNLSGQSLVVGQTYTLTAIPGTDYVFDHWTGGVTSSSPVLTFVMRSGLVLEAVFAGNHVTNIVQGFAMTSANYTGLFGDEDPFRVDRSGSFTVTTTRRLTCSGTLQLGAKRYSFSGQLGVGGFAANVFARYRTNVVGVELLFGDNGDPDEVNGRLTTGAWQTLLRGHHAAFNPRINPALCAGRYTLVIPGQEDPRVGPEGDGIAAVKVDSQGRATLTGTLADGTKVSHKAVISKRGQWPLHVPLYSGGGSVLTWLTVTNAATNGILGRMHWIKPTMPKSKHYAGGFTNLTQVAGSCYLRPSSSTNRVLNLAQADVVFDGGNLAATLTNTVALSPKNKIINLSGGKLSFAISSSVGLFSGSVVDPFTRRSLKFKGALLQDQNCGFGFLLGTNRSSRVWFGM